MEYTYDDVISIVDIKRGTVKMKSLLDRKAYLFDFVPNMNRINDAALHVIRRINCAVSPFESSMTDHEEDYIFVDENDCAWKYAILVDTSRKPVDLSIGENRMILAGKPIRLKGGTEFDFIITGFKDDSVRGNNCNGTDIFITSNELLDYYEFADGTAISEETVRYMS